MLEMKEIPRVIFLAAECFDQLLSTNSLDLVFDVILR